MENETYEPRERRSERLKRMEKQKTKQVEQSKANQQHVRDILLVELIKRVVAQKEHAGVPEHHISAVQHESFCMLFRGGLRCSCNPTFTIISSTKKGIDVTSYQIEETAIGQYDLRVVDEPDVDVAWLTEQGLLADDDSIPF